jgi:hypothetical protein
MRQIRVSSCPFVILLENQFGRLGRVPAILSSWVATQPTSLQLVGSAYPTVSRDSALSGLQHRQNFVSHLGRAE